MYDNLSETFMALQIWPKLLKSPRKKVCHYMSMTKVNRNAELTLLYLYSCSELCLAASMLHSLCASALKKFAEDCTVIILARVSQSSCGSVQGKFSDA